MRFVFWNTAFFQTLNGDGACDLSFGIRISSKLLRGTGLAICLLGYEFLPQSEGGRGLRFVFWDTNFFHNLTGDGACDLSFGIRISSKLLTGTGLAICLLGYEFLPNS